MKALTLQQLEPIARAKGISIADYGSNVWGVVYGVQCDADVYRKPSYTYRGSLHRVAVRVGILTEAEYTAIVAQDHRFC